MTNRYQELFDLVKETQDDFVKFYEKENQVAGTRIRTKMQKIKVLAQEIRKEVQEIKNNRK